MDGQLCILQIQLEAVVIGEEGAGGPTACRRTASTRNLIPLANHVTGGVDHVDEDSIVCIDWGGCAPEECRIE